MKKQKRFLTSQAINDAIDKQNARIVELTAEQESMDKEGHELLKHPETIEDGRYKIARAAQIRESSIPRIESKLQKLKLALSEFNTTQFDFAAQDRSVVI